MKLLPLSCWILLWWIPWATFSNNLQAVTLESDRDGESIKSYGICWRICFGLVCLGEMSRRRSLNPSRSAMTNGKKSDLSSVAKFAALCGIENFSNWIPWMMEIKIDFVISNVGNECMLGFWGVSKDSFCGGVCVPSLYVSGCKYKNSYGKQRDSDLTSISIYFPKFGLISNTSWQDYGYILATSV